MKHQMTNKSQKAISKSQIDSYAQGVVWNLNICRIGVYLYFGACNLLFYKLQMLNKKISINN